MKKFYLFAALGALILTTSCNTKTEDKNTDINTPSIADTTINTDTTLADTTAADTVVKIANTPFETKKFEKKKGKDELEIEYPVKGNKELLKSIRTWINEELGNKYRGKLDNATSFFHVYASLLGDDPDLQEFGGYAKDEFDLEFVNDYIVTYDHTSILNEGGPHDIKGTYGATFRQSDGKKFNKKCFTSYNKMQKLFVEGLKRYFKVKSESELAKRLNDGALRKLSAPGTEPWIDKEGVVFAYIPYEIAPYEAGTPTFTIPYAEIEPYLTPEGKSFFGK